MRTWIISLILSSSFILATEIDSFSTRDPKMQDALEELNSIMQRYLRQASEQANQKNTSCDSTQLAEILHSLAGDKTWAKIEIEISQSNILDHKTILRQDSIYRDISFIDGYGIYLAKLGHLMKIKDFYIGSDKLGHFIGIGYSYYQHSSLEEALDFGELTERTYFGLGTTAIYSYGDLSANYEGYLFWNRLTAGKNPYFVCIDNQWKQNIPFNWMDYISPAWDEGINCNYYKNESITKAIHKRIQDLGFQCPVNKNYCHEMIQRYGYLSPRLIHSSCFRS